eukprot:CAMPEP_0182426964 /NCGR_PEP_ID=MMETSP1167-20130531/13485_1 /TAXON_ID=2988 /ORGANISM="Mallomonas Sp, Strain CCMP3275" /LENGTH=379 /DNA_ID=CAMNT_0024608755 /DNA_START=250 /DNA_END=1386 /DNA_ORIENTATION=+
MYMDIAVINNSINNAYDQLHVPFAYKRTGILPHHQAKRCVCLGVHESIRDYKNGIWKTYSKGHQILVNSPCLGSDSLGNNLGMYFEAISCANATGAHLITVSKIWEPKQDHQPSVFLNALPSIFQHPNPVTDRSTLLQRLSEVCKCPSKSCHDDPNGVWLQNIPQIVSLFKTALSSHLDSLSEDQRVTVVHPGDMASVPNGVLLPFIPDAVIHYRCGDNFIGKYGFLPFAAFLEYIPSSVRTIYVLADARGRKTSTRDKQHFTLKCDAVFNKLYEYLTHHFTSATVVIRRGGNLYTDLVRLTYAKTVICSVSTFCLWPAIANNGTSLFPWTPLVAGGRMDIPLGFTWLNSPPVILGEPNKQLPPAAFVKMLSSSDPQDW